jgi:hypothetical protein
MPVVLCLPEAHRDTLAAAARATGAPAAAAATSVIVEPNVEAAGIDHVERAADARGLKRQRCAAKHTQYALYSHSPVRGRSFWRACSIQWLVYMIFEVADVAHVWWCVL